MVFLPREHRELWWPQGGRELPVGQGCLLDLIPQLIIFSPRPWCPVLAESHALMSQIAHRSQEGEGKGIMLGMQFGKGMLTAGQGH